MSDGPITRTGAPAPDEGPALRAAYARVLHRLDRAIRASARAEDYLRCADLDAEREVLKNTLYHLNRAPQGQ